MTLRDIMRETPQTPVPLSGNQGVEEGVRNS